MDLTKYNVKELHDTFMSAEPFHHIVIDNFMNEEFLKNVVREIRELPEENWFNKKFKNINDEGDSACQSKKKH